MIVAGLGFNTSATPKSLAKALDSAMLTAGITRLDALATATQKAADPALINFAAARALPLIATDVAGVATPSQSPRVQVLFGTGSLAEAAALVACGAGAQIIAAKIASPCGRATAAIATTAAIAISKDTA